MGIKNPELLHFSKITSQDNKELIAILDSNNEIIIPFQEAKLHKYFHTKDEKNIVVALELVSKDTIQYFHIHVKDDGKSQIVWQTDPDSILSARLEIIEESDKYWLLVIEGETPQYAIYDIKERKIATDFFDNITFELKEPSSIHFATFEKDIKYYYLDDKNNEQEVYLTTIMGYLDQNLNFSSYLVDFEDEQLYNSKSTGLKTTSNRYKLFLKAIQEKHTKEFERKSERFFELMDYLFDNPIDTEDFSKKQEQLPTPKQKIIEFKQS